MRQDIKDRSAHMRKIPDKAMEWMKDFHTCRLFYKISGRYATITCSKCGNRYERAFKAVDTYEGQFERLIKQPEHNAPGVCPYCNTVGVYKAAGRVKNPQTLQKKCLIGQRHGQDFCFRFFEVTLRIPGPSTYQTRQEASVMEYIRVWCQKGKKAQKDFYLSSIYAEDQWYPRNIGGMANIPMPYPVQVYPGTHSEIRKTDMFKYIPEPENFYYNYWMAAAQFNPDFEMIAKAGKKTIINAMIVGTISYQKAAGKTPEDRLGIYKSRLRYIVEHDDPRDLPLFKLERSTKNHWSDEDINLIKEIDYWLTQKNLRLLMKHTTPKKLMKYFKEQTKTSSGMAKYGFRISYNDYLDMRQAAGYDLDNEIYLFPKDLKRRHDEMVIETNKIKLDKRCKEVNEKYKQIPKRQKGLMDKYGAAGGDLILIAPHDAAEIVLEGRVLHHCVGGDTYLARHNTGQSAIMFLRKKDKKDMPYITIEIKDTTIKQWYGEHDTKPDKVKIDAWLKKYTEELKKRLEKPKKKQELKAG